MDRDGPLWDHDTEIGCGIGAASLSLAMGIPVLDLITWIDDGYPNSPVRVWGTLIEPPKIEGPDAWNLEDYSTWRENHQEDIRK